ncbi:MAG: hypothetical protein COB53_08205 [Elusimicrobia bacterium]|nr:MAG: hypothetical protein COB53_08205 [Elusimicrobiota bacterium]
MRLLVSLTLSLLISAPSAFAAAVRPDGAVLVPDSKPETVKPKPSPRPKTNRAFWAALPQLEQPRWTVPVRVTRLLPKFEEEDEDDVYLDFFLNEEVEDLP